MTQHASKFPYKTLIWAGVALVAMFLFSTEFKSLLGRADEVAIFGIELKVGKEQAQQLEAAIQSYKDKVAAFNEEVEQQQAQIAQLETIKNQLENDMANCPDAQNNTALLNIEFDKILKTNTMIQKQSDVLQHTKILRRIRDKEKLPVQHK